MNQQHKNDWLVFGKKLPSLFFGLAVYALAVLLMRDAGLGMNPWGVFHMGVSNHTPLSLGQVTQLTGLVIIGLSLVVKMVPGFASICNMIFIGMFVDFIDSLGILKTPETLIGQILMLMAGIFLTGWASFFYLRPRLGAGPRDSLMEGLVRKTNKPVWMIRGIIEVSALTVGFLLGGPVGVGTLITATTIGFSVQFAFKMGRYDAKGKHIDFLQLYKGLRGGSASKETAYSK
ncbi:putative membrane protein YczE [Alkaliphilus hydrothermalis]|uniref:Membrane protein YczE n=1 Tax=Alkaliphilus hydrothermalis TaxID=1482730 RepID=A0ABS2NQI6_9FIRM|nr:membrane protein [Alkaliphilus hydrothermalis]MBM7615210.1 putative membrane protein YczE [Alkaliphilus hydrothermalis]